MRARARSRRVRPLRWAAPYSVTTQSTSQRPVVTAAPASSRERASGADSPWMSEAFSPFATTKSTRFASRYFQSRAFRYSILLAPTTSPMARIFIELYGELSFVRIVVRIFLFYTESSERADDLGDGARCVRPGTAHGPKPLWCAGILNFVQFPQTARTQKPKPCW